MPKVIKYLELARKISGQSTSIQQQMCALAVRSGKIISIGINRKNSHAETRCLRPNMDFEGCDLFVSRWNGRTSRPCPKCQLKAVDAGINRCYYIGLDGSIIEERLGLYQRKLYC